MTPWPFCGGLVSLCGHSTSLPLYVSCCLGCFGSLCSHFVAILTFLRETLYMGSVKGPLHAVDLLP